MLLRLITACLALSGVALGIPTITTTTLPNGRVGTLYDQQLTATGTQGNVTWSLASGLLPAGLSLASNNGRITGTPTAAGTSTFTVQATDRNGVGTQLLSITVEAAPLTITTPSLPDAPFNAPYSQTLAASGGTTPYTWSLTAGTLPVGLSLSSSGTISGTPTGSGTSTFTVTVFDAGGRSTPKQFSITVTATPVTIATGSLLNGTV